MKEKLLRIGKKMRTWLLIFSFLFSLFIGGMIFGMIKGYAKAQFDPEACERSASMMSVNWNRLKTLGDNMETMKVKLTQEQAEIKDLQDDLSESAAAVRASLGL